MIIIKHQTDLRSALRILREDFIWQQCSLSFEKGANFFDTDRMILGQITKKGVIIAFEWHGKIIEFDNKSEYFEDNVLYIIGGHRLFIRKNSSFNLIMIDFHIDSDAYLGYFGSNFKSYFERIYRIYHGHLFSKRLRSPFRVQERVVGARL